VTSVNPDLP